MLFDNPITSTIMICILSYRELKDEHLFIIQLYNISGVLQLDEAAYMVSLAPAIA